MPTKYVTSAAVRLFQPAVVDGVRVGYDAKTGHDRELGLHRPHRPELRRPVPGHAPGRAPLTDGNKFKVSPRARLRLRHHRAGRTLVARGGFGIFYDRPQGNQVFDLITNPPGMQVTTLQWGLANQIGSGTGTLYAPVSLDPNEYEWKTPKVYQWNAGHADAAAGDASSWTCRTSARSRATCSSSGRSTRCPTARPTWRRARIRPGARRARAAPRSARFRAATPCRPTSCGPTQGYGAIRMWEFSAYCELQGPADAPSAAASTRA